MEKNKATSPEKKAAREVIRARSKGVASRAQADRLLEALRRFGVITFEAMRYLDVYHCPARVLQLCHRGHNIITHWETVITESGERHRIGMYLLAGKEATR